MAREFRSFEVTIPAGTLRTAPAEFPLDMPARIVRAIRWRVPPGPNGLMGWALAASGQPVLPWNADSWVVADDESDRWTVEGVIETGAWSLVGWNEGTYGHTIYLTFELDPPGVELLTQPLLPLVITPSQ